MESVRIFQESPVLSEMRDGDTDRSQRSAQEYRWQGTHYERQNLRGILEKRFERHVKEKVPRLEVLLAERKSTRRSHRSSRSYRSD